MTIIEAPKLHVAHAPAKMLRCLMMRGGTVAVSGLKIWTRTKPMRRTPASTSSAMMRPLLQAYLEPPHCSARRRQMTPGSRNKRPRLSSWASF